MKIEIEDYNGNTMYLIDIQHIDGNDEIYNRLAKVGERYNFSFADVEEPDQLRLQANDIHFSRNNSAELTCELIKHIY